MIPHRFGRFNIYEIIRFICLVLQRNRFVRLAPNEESPVITDKPTFLMITTSKLIGRPGYATASEIRRSAAAAAAAVETVAWITLPPWNMHSLALFETNGTI